jgi:hypothetical protein
MGGSSLAITFLVPIMGVTCGPLHGWSLQGVPPGHCFPSSASTDDYWRSFNFPGGVHAPVPSIIFGRGCSRPSSHMNHPHVHASLVSTLASAASLLHPFVHKDSSSASDVSMSFWNTSSAAVAADTMGGNFPPDAPLPQNTSSVPLVAMGGVVPPPVVPVPMGGSIPLHMVGGVLAPIPGAAPLCVPLEGMVPPQAPFPQASVPFDGALPPHAPLLAVSSVPPPAPPTAIIRIAEPFKLLTIKDAKAYLDHYCIIQYYLRCP